MLRPRPPEAGEREADGGAREHGAAHRGERSGVGLSAGRVGKERGENAGRQAAAADQGDDQRGGARGSWRRRRRLEHFRLAAAVLAIGGVKLLVEDLRRGDAAYLVFSLALYGGALIAVPALARRARRPVAAGPSRRDLK